MLSSMLPASACDTPFLHLSIPEPGPTTNVTSFNHISSSQMKSDGSASKDDDEQDENQGQRIVTDFIKPIRKKWPGIEYK